MARSSISRLSSCILISVRALTKDEVSEMDLFTSGYRSTKYMRLERSGVDPEVSWNLTIAGSRREVVRTLEGDTLDVLVQLYGPAGTLRFLGAFEKDELVGLLTWKLEEWNEMVWLCDIRVRDGHRQKGVGSLLLTDLQWAASRVDARGIMLETQNTNVVAIAFYLSKGFQLVGLNSALYGRPGRANADVALFFYLSLGD